MLRMLRRDRTTQTELPRRTTSDRTTLHESPQAKTERKHRNDTKYAIKQNELVGLLRIFYGDEHWRSVTPRIEATERNDRTSSKPNYKGWVDRTTSEFAVGLTRTTASDSSGDIGNSWKRSYCTDRQLNDETVPPYLLFERTSVFVCFALRTQAKPDEIESI